MAVMRGLHLCWAMTGWAGFRENVQDLMIARKCGAFKANEEMYILKSRILEY